MKNTHPLPSKLSDLILVALEDLEKAEKDPRYEVDMGAWHSPDPRPYEPCRVCLAGSVMAFGLGTKATDRRYPSNFIPEIENKLSALNGIRVGYFLEGEVENFFPVSDYDYDSERWKTEMVLTAHALKEIGL